MSLKKRKTPKGVVGPTAEERALLGLDRPLTPREDAEIAEFLGRPTVALNIKTLTERIRSDDKWSNHDDSWTLLTKGEAKALLATLADLLAAAKLTVSTLDDIGNGVVGWVDEYEALTTAIAKAEGS